MFVYTKNEKVIHQLEAEGCRRIQTLSNGTAVYALSPTSTFIFSEQEDTCLKTTLTL